MKPYSGKLALQTGVLTGNRRYERSNNPSNFYSNANATELNGNTWFTASRTQIIENLRSNQNDKSLAGKVDARIKPLVDWINEASPSSDYVTSSSCSGRLLLFHRADSSSLPRQKKRGSLGVGKIIETHDPVESVKNAVESIYLPALRTFIRDRSEQRCHLQVGDNPSPSKVISELLHLQFRPMIIHVLANNMQSAVKLLECARESGQNNSGIISCSRFIHSTESQRDSSSHAVHGRDSVMHSAHGVPQKITCCISSSLCMDVPLLSGERWLLPELEKDRMANEFWVGLLEQCVEHANMLFEENFVRLDRFSEQLKKRLII